MNNPETLPCPFSDPAPSQPVNLNGSPNRKAAIPSATASSSLWARPAAVARGLQAPDAHRQMPRYRLGLLSKSLACRGTPARRRCPAHRARRTGPRRRAKEATTGVGDFRGGRLAMLGAEEKILPERIARRPVDLDAADLCASRDQERSDCQS